MVDADRLLTAGARLHVDRVTAETVGSLRQADVDPILLRGPALACWLYDDELERPYADIDLLVPEDRLSDVRRVLGQLGLTESEIETRFATGRPRHAETWLRLGDGLSVDLHRTVIGVGIPPRALWEAISRGREPLNVGGLDVSTPSAPARALLVALHAAQHGPGWSQPLEDLDRALKRVDAETWGHARRLADELDATASFAAGLRLLPAGRSLAEKSGFPRDHLPDNRLRGADRFHVTQGLGWMLDRPGIAGKVVFLARKAAPPAETMRLRSSLARRGRLGLGLAYAWRFMRLSWHTAMTFPGVLRGRRRR
jgi:hypothetical protein